MPSRPAISPNLRRGVSENGGNATSAPLSVSPVALMVNALAEWKAQTHALKRCEAVSAAKAVTDRLEDRERR